MLEENEIVFVTEPCLSETQKNCSCKFEIARPTYVH